MTKRHLALDDMIVALGEVLRANGCSHDVAQALATNCASAERDGSKSHGLFRMAGYVSTLRSGWVDGHARPVVEDAAPGFVRVDAQNGFTLPAHDAARALVEEKARQNGIAALAIRNSHHLGALYLDVEPYAEKGLIALSVINSMAVVVHPGSTKPVYGTNPIAFATPRAEAGPLLFDFATSAMAHGDVQVAAQQGRQLLPGTGVDAEGQPTQDPNAILSGGALLPFGGHKGMALAMMVEILCAALVGGQFSYEVDWSEHPGAHTPRTGQTLIVIDPTAGAGSLAPFAARVEALIQEVLSGGPVRLPSEERYPAREIAAKEGIAVDAAQWDAILALKAPAEAVQA
ncbi:Ldh family oxidoreductase [Paracoccus ravus]|uniref:Ldh family oxidoreductase n=1 Tax=Paracoccus ravus TaxID=2447760 RepID=UPI001FD6AB62|nr:Ldh family oxidoreductase [Paracoccus ravus]